MLEFGGGDFLVPVPQSEWASLPASLNEAFPPLQVWRKAERLVFHWLDAAKVERLSIWSPDGGLTWDELQNLKAEAAFSNCWAAEIYPPDHAIVNLQNMRHLVLLDGMPFCGWRNGARRDNELTPRRR